MYHLCPGCEVETFGELLCPDCRTAYAKAKVEHPTEEPQTAAVLSAEQTERDVWTWLRPAGARHGWAAARH